MSFNVVISNYCVLLSCSHISRRFENPWCYFLLFMLQVPKMSKKMHFADFDTRGKSKSFLITLNEFTFNCLTFPSFRHFIAMFAQVSMVWNHCLTFLSLG